MAFEKACRRLGLSLTPDAMTESVAKVIIDLAEAGETDAERLYQRPWRISATPVEIPAAPLVRARAPATISVQRSL